MAARKTRGRRTTRKKRASGSAEAPRAAGKKAIEQYEHRDKKRANNPPVGLVRPENDPDGAKKTYAFDPHLDPQLQWAGKAEHTSFDVPTVSLHVHERIDPKSILAAVRRRNGGGPASKAPAQISLFETREENPPLREALDFYQHAHGWSNRLVAGDSLLVMNSLLEKEGMAGKVQMVYLDPPYGIRYGSNFQPFVNKRDVKDGKDEDLNQEPEMIRAFRDTWELEIHSYLTYLRDRLLLARELLHESGSIFVQISDENVHHVREIMDEICGARNFVAVVTFVKASGFPGLFLPRPYDFLVWYAKDKAKAKFQPLYREKSVDAGTAENYSWLELPSGERRGMTRPEREDSRSIPKGARVYKPDNITSQGNPVFSFAHNGKTYSQAWKTTPEGLGRLAAAKRLHVAANSLQYVRYLTDFPCVPVTQYWDDTGTGSFLEAKTYVVQTAVKVLARCILMTTDPGDLVFDPTCGSGTTAFAAEQWGRRWITCDTSRVALTLAKQRLMTAAYDYYELKHPSEGVGSGFVYKTVPHVTLKSIANNPEIKKGMTREAIDRAIAKFADQETLYDQPKVDKTKARVTGPFTVEAVPAPVVKPLDLAEEAGKAEAADASEARSGETLRHAEWREELLKTGIRGKAGQRISFSRVEPLAGTRWLHAEAESKAAERETRRGADRVGDAGGGYGAQRVVVSFGPEHAPLEQKQVERAWQEAGALHPRPALLVFAAFQFDPEAAKDIDALTPDKAGMTLLKAQMNPDMFTADLKKKRSSNESFWLIGQPDVELRRIEKGENKGLYELEVRGFDYYDTKSGQIHSGSADQIAVWLLDPDYDDRSLLPRQVFFPMAGEGEGWARLARSLRAELDEERLEAYRGTVSLPFEAKRGQKVAVKLVDDRGIESLRVLEVD